MEARFEEIRKKYRMAKREEGNIDLPSLKSEIASYIADLRAADGKYEDLLAETQDMLIDLTKIIEESHCQPFRSKRFNL